MEFIWLALIIGSPAGFELLAGAVAKSPRLQLIPVCDVSISQVNAFVSSCPVPGVIGDRDPELVRTARYTCQELEFGPISVDPVLDIQTLWNDSSVELG